MKKLRRRLRTTALVLAGLAALAAAATLQPFQGYAKEQFLEFPRGASTSQIAKALSAAGVIRHPALFLLARALRPASRIQAGEYRFEQPANVWQVLERLNRGDVYLVELRIPEGYNLYDIAEVVADSPLLNASGFTKAASNPALIRDLAPNAPSLEGFLFPSTYRLPRKITAEGLCRVLTDQFRKEWKAVNGSGNVLQTVTLASLVEKETGAPEERPLVAGVYRNRLQQGMKMEADPTTIYAAILTGAWTGVIHKSDLQRQHPYNTYAVTGLPPGPIANPGRASLAAALHPKPTDFVYFVAKADGTHRHNFAKSYADHQRNVQTYRRAR